jgi:hypothetical protein
MISIFHILNDLFWNYLDCIFGTGGEMQRTVDFAKVAEADCFKDLEIVY